VICTLNPSPSSKEETKSTIRFATRIKKVSLKVEKNEIMDDKALIAKYRATVSFAHFLKKGFKDDGFVDCGASDSVGGSSVVW
jgi:hypothetical protein